jgi:hypothetical protein
MSKDTKDDVADTPEEKKENEKHMKMNTKVYTYNKDGNYVVGDVIIEIINNLLSPFQQVDYYLNGIYEDTELMKKHNTYEKGKLVSLKENIDNEKQFIYNHHTFQNKFTGAGKKRNRKTKKHSTK